MSSPVVRFAPSPTGRLHIGNIRTALFNWHFAKRQGGTFVLRLDDTDRERSTQEFADGIVEDLGWLGVIPDQIHRQSDRDALYDAAADSLREQGLLYACYETPDEIDRRRKRLMARGLPPVYDRSALRLTDDEKVALEAEGRKPHWRFLLPNHGGDPFETSRTEVSWIDVIRGDQIVDLASMSDPVLIREDGTYLYTLPSVVDDAEMEITHVIRGGDHITNTAAQIALFKALGHSNVPEFGHHNLLTSADGEGLSKRTGALSVLSLRESGLEPMAINSLATLVGSAQAVEAFPSLLELSDHFDPKKVSRSAAKFSVEELNGLNRRLVHDMSYSQANDRLKVLNIEIPQAFWELVRENLDRFEDVEDWIPVLKAEAFSPELEGDDLQYLELALADLPAEPWGETVWKDWTSGLKEKSGRKGRALFMPLRKALTGFDHGPDMAALLPIIGAEKTRLRLHALCG